MNMHDHRNNRMSIWKVSFSYLVMPNGSKSIKSGLNHSYIKVRYKNWQHPSSH